jgi:hypothetical protein
MIRTILKSLWTFTAERIQNYEDTLIGTMVKKYWAQCYNYH